MKKIFFIFLDLLVCCSFGFSLEGMTAIRKQEIIESIKNGTLNNIQNNEVDAILDDGGNGVIFKTEFSNITTKNTTPLALALEFYTDNQQAIVKMLLNKNANLFHEYSIDHGYRPQEKSPITELIKPFNITEYSTEMTNWLIRNNQVNKALDKDSNTLLHLLIDQDKSNIHLFSENIKNLIKNGANVKALNSKKLTPFHLALGIGANKNPLNSSIVNYIINETDINLTENYTYELQNIQQQNTLLKNVLVRGDFSNAKAATEKIIQKKQYDKNIDNKKNNLIHHFVQDDLYLDQVKDLITADANLEAINEDGLTALHIALNVKNNRASQIASQLIESKKINLTKLYSISDNGYTRNESLFKNIWNTGNEDLIYKAIDSIFDLNQYKIDLDTQGNKITHYLVRDKNIFDIYVTKVNRKKEIVEQKDLKNNVGQTPLYTACQAGNLDAVKKLIQLGANPLLITNKEESLLHAAVENSGILTYLLQETNAKSLINQADTGEKKTPIQMLIEKVTDTNPQNMLKYNNNIKLLLEYGAKKDVLEDTIKNSHSYKNWGPQATQKLNQVIDIINDTNANSAMSSSSTGSSSSSSSGAGSSSSHTHASPPQKKVTKTTPPLTVKKAKDPLTKQLSTLTKKLTTLKEKLKDLAANLGLLKTKLGVTK